MQVEKLCLGCMEDDSGSPPCPRCGWQPELDSPLYIPPSTVLHDQYIVGRTLGHGGFGITYLAWDLNLERRVALKEYLPNGVATRAGGTLKVSTYSGQKASYDLGLQKFLEEARVLARFQSHPGMVAVQFFFQANGTAYLVMEYLDGMTLDAYLKEKGGKVPFARAMDVLMPVMDALREVHKTGILHRDVSPDNIYITRSGPVKLLDFGAARYALGEHSQNFSIILKEGYAPEEQYRSKGHQGPWTDVYACAATLYRAITGKLPPPALDRIHQDELEPPSALGIALPPGAEEALMKALAIDASNRYQSMEDFQKDIGDPRHGDSAEIRNVTVPLRPPTNGTHNSPAKTLPVKQIPIPKKPSWQARVTPRSMVAGGAVAAAVLVLLVVLHLLQSGPTPTPAPAPAPAAPRSAPAASIPPPSAVPPPARPPESTGGLLPPPPPQALPRQSRSAPFNPSPVAPRSSLPPRQSAVPPPSIPVTPATPPEQNYQALIAQAEGMLRQNNAAGALQMEQRAVQLNPALPTAYDMIGFTYLYDYGNYGAARQNMNAAIDHGGFALFRVRHDRYDGSFTTQSMGMLRVSSTAVTYASEDRSDTFTIGRGSIESAALNSHAGTVFRHFLGSAERTYNHDKGGSADTVHGAFHIKTASENYNLVGTSSDPAAEAGIILELLNR